MINKIEGSLLSLSAALYIGAQGVANQQLLKGISQICLGSALLLRGNRSEKGRIGLMAAGVATIALGLFNSYCTLQSPQTFPLSDRWNITVSKTLQKHVAEFNDATIAHEVQTEEFDQVGWDHFIIHSIAEKRLITTQLGPCIGLATRGFDEAGKLTHIGLAHSFASDKMPVNYFEELRKVIKGRIELFIAGGDREADSRLRAIYSLANQHHITILHNVAKRFFKEFYLPYQNMLYSASYGISQIYFDPLFNLRLHGDLNVIGLQN